MPKATFTFGTQITGTSENLTYSSMTHDERGKHWLEHLNAYTETRFNLWGGRDERGESLRCFMTFNKGDIKDTPIGYVNIGVNNFESVNTIEFGISFNMSVKPEYVSEAAISVLKDYVIQTRNEQGKLVEYKKVFGTISPSTENPLTDKLLNDENFQKSGFKVSESFDDFIKEFAYEGNRFQASKDGKLQENMSGTFKDKVYFSLDLPPVVELSGTAEGILDS